MWIQKLWLIRDSGPVRDVEVREPFLSQTENQQKIKLYYVNAAIAHDLGLVRYSYQRARTDDDHAHAHHYRH